MSVNYENMRNECQAKDKGMFKCDFLFSFFLSAPCLKDNERKLCTVISSSMKSDVQKRDVVPPCSLCNVSQVDSISASLHEWMIGLMGREKKKKTVNGLVNFIP